MFDVDAMIQAADLEVMLTEMGLEPQRRQNKNGFELYINCFNPKHDDNQRKMSMAEVGQYKGLFFCWSCKFRGNIVQIIECFLNMEFHDALVWMQTKTGVGELLGTQSLIYKVKKEKLNYGVTTQSKDLPTFTLPEDFVSCQQGDRRTFQVETYLAGRGITPETQRKFGVGSSIHHDVGRCATIPIIYDERIVSIYYGQPRNGGLKRYPKNSPQGEILFNYDECVEYDRYVMVESILDVLMLDSLELGPAMACFTNMVSDQQLKLMKPFGKHAVFPDMDSERGWDLVTRMVGGLDKSVQLILPPQGKDPGDCKPWEIVDSYAQSQCYADWEVDGFMLKASQPTGSIIRLQKK